MRPSRIFFVGADDLNRGVARHLSPVDAADTEHALVTVVVEARNLKLKRPVDFHPWRVDEFDDRFEQRRHVAAAVCIVDAGIAVQCRGVDHREVELFVSGAEPIEQFEYLVDDPVGAGAVSVDLVDHDDRGKSHGKGFLRDETRLRHRSLDRVYQQQHRVDHRQDAFYLATEIGVSRSVDDIDTKFLPAARLSPVDRGILRQNSDAAFLFELVRVHDPFANFGTAVERSRLTQQLVDQRGFTVVDMRDDCDIAQIVSLRAHRGLQGRIRRAIIMKWRHSTSAQFTVLPKTCAL